MNLLTRKEQFLHRGRLLLKDIPQQMHQGRKEKLQNELIIPPEQVKW